MRNEEIGEQGFGLETGVRLVWEGKGQGGTGILALGGPQHEPRTYFWLWLWLSFQVGERRRSE